MKEKKIRRVFSSEQTVENSSNTKPYTMTEFQTNRMGRNNNNLNSWVLLSIAILGSLGLTLLSLSFLSYGQMKSSIDALSLDGDVSQFTKSIFALMVIMLRACGIAILGTIFLLYRRREWVRLELFRMSESVKVLTNDTVGVFKQVFAKQFRNHIYAFSVILTVGIILRLFFLFQPMRWDEAFTFMDFASQPLYLALSNYSEPNNHLFHTLLVHVSYSLFGAQPWAIRLPAMLAGLLLVPAVYVMGYLFFNRCTGLIAAGLVASSPYITLYSTNGRGYTIVSFIFLILLCLSKYLKDNQNVAAWTAFGAWSAIGFYTIPTMLYPYGIVVVWLVLSCAVGDCRLGWRQLYSRLIFSTFITGIVSIVLYSPVFLQSGIESVTRNRFVGPASSSLLAFELAQAIPLLWSGWNMGLPDVVSWLLLTSTIVGIVFHRHISSHKVSVLLAACIWCVLLLIVTHKVPFSRVWSFLLPIYLILASAGLSYALSRAFQLKVAEKGVLIPVFAACLAIFLGVNAIRGNAIHNSDETGTLRDAGSITMFLKRHLTPEDGILAVVPSTKILEYYFHLLGVPAEYPVTIRQKGALFVTVWVYDHGRLNFVPNAESVNRLFVIVNEGRGQSLERVLRRAGLSLNTHSSLKLIQRYNDASIYELRRAYIVPPMSRL